MALNKTALKNGVRMLTDSMYVNAENKTPEECREIFATELSNLIDEFVKSGTVTVNVATTGTATNHTGSGTGAVT